MIAARTIEASPATIRLDAPYVARTAGLVAIAYLVGVLAGLTPLWASWPVAILVGLAMAWLPQYRLLPGVSALLIVGVVAESSLVPDAGKNHPLVVLGLPLLVMFLDRYRSRREQTMRPATVVGFAAIAYLVVAGVWAPIQAASLHFGATYLVATIAFGLALGMVLLPTLLPEADHRYALLATLVVLGPLLALVEILSIIVGPFKWFGTYVGTWVFLQLTILGQPAPLIFARVTGPFARPAGASTVFAISLIALVALWPAAGHRLRRWAPWLMAASVIGLWLTQNRDGWLIAFTGGLAVLGLRAMRRRLDLPPLALVVVFGGLLVALSLNILGGNLRSTAAAHYYGVTVADSIPGSDEDVPVQIRGGTSLTGRDDLWSASLKAIRERPILGWGLAQDQAAIAPLLPPEAQRFAGLTSDSLWLKTAVETGLLGLAALVAWCLATLWVMARRVWAQRAEGLDPLGEAAVAGFIGLLAGGTFETYLLGGLTFPSFELALFAGAAVAVSGPLLPLLAPSRRTPAEVQAEPGEAI